LVIVGVGEELIVLKRVAILILALSIILSLSGCFGGGGNSNGIKTFNVTGRVTSSATGLGISGATVAINDDYNFTAYTNQAGYYQLNGVTTYDSRVRITVSKDGYEVQSKYESITGGSSYIWDFKLVPKSSGSGVLVRGWVDYGYNESYGQTASYPMSSHRAWTEPDVMKEPDSVIVELTGDVRTASVSTLMRDVNAREYKVRELINRVIIKVPEGEFLDDFMAKLRESPMVRSVEPNGIVYAARVPNDPLYASHQKWWLQLMNLPAAWEKTTGSSGVTIAIIDTGIRYDHLDLPSLQNLVSPRDYVDDDYDPFDPGLPSYHDNHEVASHGTHVAGTIGALTNNGIGVVGVDWSVRLMPVRVLDENGNGYVSDVAAGIRWAVDNGADVINLSLGTSEESDTLRASVQHAYSSGVIVVAASGNNPPFTKIVYPARYDKVIAVGAAGDWLNPFEVASFSLGGTELDIIAPGVGVCSTNYNSSTRELGYQSANGTSMACPHVAGVVGLMLAEDPLLTPDKVRKVLRETAIRPGNGQVWDTWQGYGFVNAYAAVTQATLDKAQLVVLDEQLKHVSAVVAPGSDRGFAFSDVPQAYPLYVFGWLDVDGSGALDVGDYTGYKEISTYGQNEVDASFRLNIHSTWDAGTREFIAGGLEAMGAH
jgi:subtilisin family serine protease